MSIRLLFLLFLVAVIEAKNSKVAKLSKSQYDLCKLATCKNLTTQSNDLLEYCAKKSGFIFDRCCLTNVTDAADSLGAVATASETNSIIGLDLSDCGIKNLATTLNNYWVESYAKIGLLDLRSNSELSECSDDTYYGFVKLNQLYLPPACNCPGLNYSWASFDNHTCIGLKAICNTTFPRVNCTENSRCVEYGPANFQCSCKEGYHSYKCLEEGEFPTLTFTIVLCALTLTLSAFLWHTQRRHVKND